MEKQIRIATFVQDNFVSVFVDIDSEIKLIEKWLEMKDRMANIISIRIVFDPTRLKIWTKVYPNKKYLYIHNKRRFFISIVIIFYAFILGI